MAKQIIKKTPNSTKAIDQVTTDIIAVGLSNLFGANVVPRNEFDKINKEKEDLLKKSSDNTKLKIRLLKTECKLQAFIRYHSKWKLTTKAFESRLKKLNKEKVYINFTEFPEQISENLKEAYKCYCNGLSMSCYIMILRTIEIIVSLLYAENNAPIFENDGRQKFITATNKLNWVKTKGWIGGADYQVAKAFIEARNDSVHKLYVPTDKQILSAFETVINLTKNLKDNLL